MNIKYFLITVILATAILCTGFVASAQTTDVSVLIAQLQAQIQSLMQQIAQLQAQQNTTPTPPTPVVWCYTFNNNFGTGANANDLNALLTVLAKENIYKPTVKPTQYNSAVILAVIKFQQKYKILATGFVGTLTRAKLNLLYGCVIIPTPPTTYTQCSNQKCVTVNGIGTNQCSKDSDCMTVCTPNWTCGAWSTCTNSQQNRTCADSNNCGVANSQPATTQSCASTSPSMAVPSGLEAFGQSIQVCTASCSNLPTPVFKVCPTNNPQCSPKNHYTISLNLDGQPLTTFNTPITVDIPYTAWNGQAGYTAAPDYSVSLVNSAGVVTSNGGLYVFNGASTISVYQDDFTDQGQQMFLWLITHDIKIYNGTSKIINFTTQKISNSSANIILIKDDSIPINADDILQASLLVTFDVDKLLNKPHIPYTLYAVPQLLSQNFYLGNGNISIGIEPDSKASLVDLIKAEISHEYTHAMQDKRGNYGLGISRTQPGVTGNYSPFLEGMADAVTEFTGYKTAATAFQLSKQSTNCIQDFTDPHDIGRCIFKDFFGIGLFNTTFFQRLVSLDKIYDFGNMSPINNQQYCNTLNGILSYASGTDVSNTIYQAGCTTVTMVTPPTTGTTPSTAVTCDNFKSSQPFYFNSCLSTGFDNVCIDKNSGAFQGCEKNSDNSCTANNTHASQNMLCPTNAQSATSLNVAQYSLASVSAALSEILKQILQMFAK